MTEPIEPAAGYESMSASKLLRALGGDRDLLRDIIELFQRDAPAMLGDLRRQAGGADREALARAAHVLKGSSANFGRSPLYEVTREIESLAYEGDLGAMPALMSRFEVAADGFMQTLRRLQREIES